MIKALFIQMTQINNLSVEFLLSIISILVIFGLLYYVYEKSSRRVVGVFWDFKSLSFPRGRSLESAFRRILFLDCFNSATEIAFVGASDHVTVLWDPLQETGVEVDNSHDGRSSNAKLTARMSRFVFTNLGRFDVVTVVWMSGDPEGTAYAMRRIGEQDRRVKKILISRDEVKPPHVKVDQWYNFDEDFIDLS